MVRRFEIELADSDRGVYETLDLRVAQHPSESTRYLAARVLARCLEHAEGVDFTQGLGKDDEPALWQRNLRNELLAWIEVGAPAAERLHRASKACARVAVYAWARPAELARAAAEYGSKGIHRKGELEVYALEPSFLDAIGERLDRTNRWECAVSGGGVYLTIGGKLVEGRVERVPVP